ncbi:S-formylglutathione hydrolase [Actinobacillus delphinicola]|uniref:S-formylglutathione hydrolase n=1 Tax=Actinobacillus delphinicola TaxID=51161 RepID=A0A448TSP3_9PAST|nr:S-formylglutathione hydrolase [Actinobacillus delphinicola]MDG6897192.1 S-formylglutathione hydrolase [Actinobacillus delphinicola]VEJ09012.1 putative esterase [Actinobacillus delphinicola]
MQKTESHVMFGGDQEIWQHHSDTLGCDMTFAAFIPSKAKTEKCPVLYFLSGLTCTEQNVTTKSGFQRYAEEHGIIIIAPDTSPRGEDIPNSPDYDLGQGAGFYLMATQEPWAKNFKMYDYITKELPKLVNETFNTNGKQGIFGHSMGGLGALVLALRNPEMYQSVSAFSPIVTPSIVPWGQKAFTAYLGADENTWAEYDPMRLILAGKKVDEILIDQGLSDPFYPEQLKPELFAEACEKMGVNANIRYHDGYDHSYYFIATYMEDHIKFHAAKLAK